MCTFKNLEEILKPGKKFKKTSVNPDQVSNFFTKTQVSFKISEIPRLFFLHLKNFFKLVSLFP